MKRNTKIAPEKKTKFEEVVAIEAMNSGYAKEIIVSKIKTRSIVSSRQSCMYALCILGLTLSEVAKLFDMDHSTARYMMNRVTDDEKGPMLIYKTNEIIEKYRENEKSRLAI